MKKITFIILLVTCHLSFVTLSAKAADNTFIADIYVDISANNATIAKQNAMNEANKRGLITVVKRITTDDAVSKFDALTPEQIINFIKEVDVDDEKTSNTRYIANLKVNINEDLLKIYMKEQNMPFIKDTPRDVLVIPIMRKEPHTEPLLFVDDNLWLQAWNSKTIKDGKTSFHTIKTDHNLNAQDILASNAWTLDTIAKNNNNINDIYILEAYINNDFFVVILTSYNTGLKNNFKVNMTDNPDYMNKAISEAISGIGDHIKKQRISQAQTINKIVVLYNYPTLKEWIITENKLKKADYINNLSVDAFGNSKVQFKIEYSGTMENLQKALQRNGLKLTEHPNKIFMLEKIR